MAALFRGFPAFYYYYYPRLCVCLTQAYKYTLCSPPNVPLHEEGSLRMYIHYPTAVQDGDRILIVYSVMGHPHLHLGDVGGIKIAEVPLHLPTGDHVHESDAA